MSNIAIFRQAKINQISSFSHLINKHEFTNRDPRLNPNNNNNNKIIVFDANNNEFISRDFKRDGNNEEGMKELHKIADDLDKSARADYKAHKTAEKLANPDKKIRTVLQSKNLRKEFGIFIGGDKKIEDKKEFEDNILKTALKVLEAKGLDKKNLIAVVIHYDESTPHAHINYNDYSYLHKTTGTELTKIREKNANGKSKAELNALNRDIFAQFQDITAREMNMERGRAGSRAQNRSKAQHFNILAEQSEQLKSENAILRQQNRDLKAENLDLEIDREILPVVNNLKKVVKQSTPAELQIMRNHWQPKNPENHFDFNNVIRKSIADFWDEQAIKKQKQIDDKKLQQRQKQPNIKKDLDLTRK